MKKTTESTRLNHTLSTQVSQLARLDSMDMAGAGGPQRAWKNWTRSWTNDWADMNKANECDGHKTGPRCSSLENSNGWEPRFAATQIDGPGDEEHDGGGDRRSTTGE